MQAPKTLSTDHCDSLVLQLGKSNGTHTQELRAVRNQTIASVLLETGLRVGELCGLLIDDLWYAEAPVATLVVRAEIAKTKRERTIPISRKLTDSLHQLRRFVWITTENATKDYAFFRNDATVPLTTRTVQRIIHAAARAAFNMEVTPHTLRHTFASRMMRKTNARIVQELLGHTNLQSTQLYMHPNEDDLRKAINS